MKTTDIFNNRSSKKINEAIETVFGQKLNLEAFTIEQLEDSRNRLRTQIYTVRQSSGFNETVENETFTKAQWMLDAINAEVLQREPLAVAEGADIDKQQLMAILKRFDEDMNEISGYGDPDFNKILAALNQGDVESAVEEVYGNYSDQDGGEIRSRDMDNYLEDLENAFKDLVGDDGFDPLKHIDNPTQGERDAAPDVDRGNYGDRAAMMRSAEADGRLRDGIEQNINNGEDMTQVRESATDKASAVVTAKTMVDRVGRWIEELAGMENDTLLSLGDTIRDEMGQEEAKNFLSNVAPAIQQALQNLKATRETLATGVRGLTGEEQSAEIIGSDASDMSDAGDDMGPAESDAMNSDDATTDEFAASEPATGGMETAGRAQRESIDRSGHLLRVLAG